MSEITAEVLIVAKQDTHPGLAIVIAAYNEYPKIQEIVLQLIKNFNIIVVDDGSTDRTSQELKKIHAKNFHLLRHCYNLGVGASLRTGLEYANNLKIQYCLFMDGDGQHNINDIPKFIEKKGKYDLVIGFRNLDEIYQDKKHHAIGNLILRIASLILTKKWEDVESGFRLWKVDSAMGIEFPDDYSVQNLTFLQALKKGYKIGRVNISHNPRTSEGTTKGTTIFSGFQLLIKMVLNTLILRIRGVTK